SRGGDSPRHQDGQHSVRRARQRGGGRLRHRARGDGLHRADRTNMVVGTPHYFSPEQARGLALDGRGDIYSLGVTLFRAGTGVLPFQGEDWYEIARQHVEDLPPKPRSFNPALSRGVERVILKCLEKDPAARYPTGDALHAELIQLLGRAST